MVNRIDLSLMQDVFHNIGGAQALRPDSARHHELRQPAEHNWGVGQRLVNSQILTSPTPDATGALTYNLQTLNGNLLTPPLQTTANHQRRARRTST